jgi:hypothetical protein
MFIQNHLNGLVVLATNGKIYFIHIHNQRQPSNIKSTNLIDTNIPTNLSNLATSNYNKYYK